MASDHTKKSLRSFQCRDYLWEMYAEMADDLDCSVDYLVNEAMRQYAKSRNYGKSQGRASLPPGATASDAGARESFEPENPALVAASAPREAAVAPVRSTAASLLEGADLTPAPAPLPSSRPSQVTPATPALPPMPAAAPRPSAAEGSPSFGLPPMPAAPRPASLGGLPPVHAAPAPVPMLPPLHGAAAGPAPALPPMPPLAPAVLPPLPPAPPPGGGAIPAPAAAPAVAARPSLFVIFNGQKVPVTGDEFVIGRSAKTADLAIKDGNISRRHASVVYHGGAYYMKDLGSTNGVDFSGTKVGTKRIEDGDVFTICEYELRFTYS